MADLRRHDTYTVASTGPDSAVVTTAGYGSDRIAHLRRGEECSPKDWADFKRWLERRANPAVVLVEMVATLPNGHAEKPGVLRAIEVLRYQETGGDSRERPCRAAPASRQRGACYCSTGLPGPCAATEVAP